MKKRRSGERGKGKWEEKEWDKPTDFKRKERHGLSWKERARSQLQAMMTLLISIQSEPRPAM